MMAHKLFLVKIDTLHECLDEVPRTMGDSFQDSFLDPLTTRNQFFGKLFPLHHLLRNSNSLLRWADVNWTQLAFAFTDVPVDN